MGIENPNKNDPFSGGHHTIHSFHLVSFFFFFFTIANCFTLSASEGGDAVMQAAHRTKGTSSTRCAVIWLVQNQLQGTCKAVTLLLVVLPPDFALPLQFDYAKSRKCHQSSPSLSFTTLHIFTVVGETNCVEKKKKKKAVLELWGFFFMNYSIQKWYLTGIT